MKKTFFSFLIIIHALGISGQNIIFPSYSSRDDANVEISLIGLSDTITVIEMYYLAPVDDEWICADKNFHLKLHDSNNRLFLILAKDIPLCPKRKKIERDDIYHKFLLYFPPLDTTVKRVDIIEKAGEGFNFYGVDLERKKDKPFPDSADYHSREEFEEYFSGDQNRFEPLEGIWQETARLAHYVSNKFYDFLDDKEVKEFVIMKKEEKFVCYDLEGGPLDAHFTLIAEGNRYLYKKYLRDVRREVTTFAMIRDDKTIEMSYFYPDKYARYHYPEDIMPGDKLELKLELLKLFPETSD